MDEFELERFQQRTEYREEGVNQYRFKIKEALNLCNYAEYTVNLTHEQLHRFVNVMYLYIIKGGLPEDYDSEGESWKYIWNCLFAQHRRRMDITYNTTKRECEIHYNKLLAERDAEIARLLDINEHVDPRKTFDQFIEHYEKNHESKGNLPVRKFRVSYNKSDAPIRGMEIYFAGKDGRAITSAQNGTRGGRPKSQNPSETALYKRAYRKKSDNPKPNLGLS